MANYQTAADIVDDVLFRANESESGNSDFQDAAVRYVNRAFQSLWTGGAEIDPDVQEKWWWLRKDGNGVLILNPAISTGSITVSNGATTITFSSSPTASVQGRHFKVDAHADVFKITAHTAGVSTASIEGSYTGVGVTSGSYSVFQVDYTLATDVLYLSEPMWAYQDGSRNIEMVDPDSLRRNWPMNDRYTGVPRQYTMLDDQKVRFSHAGGVTSGDFIKVDYTYVREPPDLVDTATGSLQVVPRQYRKIIADWALAYVLADKEDTKASDAIALARNGVRAMAKENRRRMSFGSNRIGRVYVRPRGIRTGLQVLRTESGLIIG